MSSHCPEERAIYVALVLAGALPAIAILIDGGGYGAGFTISVLMVAAGIAGGIAQWTRRTVLPMARIRRTRR